MTAPLSPAGQVTVPTRWRAPSAPPAWAIRLGVPERRVHADEARVVMLRTALLEADPLADQVVEWMSEQPRDEGRALFDRVVERGCKADESLPASIRQLFRAIDERPVWADRRVLQLGSETMLRVGFLGSTALAGVSLVSGYLWGALVKPLAMTGAFSRMAHRRAAETAKFVFDVATSPGLDRLSAGFKTTVRVRIMHARVRAWLRKSPTWRSEDWGVPINQQDMLVTALQFSVGFLLGIRVLGVIIDDEEREAIVHLWRYVGVLMGVREELLPTTYAEAVDLYGLIASTEAGPDDDSRELTRALLRVPMEERQGPMDRLSGRFESQFLTGYVRAALGAEAASALGVTPTPWEHAVPFVRSVVRALETVRATTPLGRQVAVRVGRAYADARVRRLLGGVAPDYRPHRLSDDR